MLSVCMIARNEEQTIRESIQSVLDIADEVILVDTGSEDSTPEIAKELGARVYDHLWNNSFSEARNQALSHAKQPWILFLDADEIVEEGQYEKIRHMLENSGADAYTVRISNLLGTIDSNEIMMGNAVRLFRRTPEYYYRGRIHEEVETSILRSGGVIAESDVSIFHYGYLEELSERKDRYERNVSLLKTELEQYGEQPKLLFDLATEYYIAGLFHEAIDCYEKALCLCDVSAAYRPRLYRNLAESYRKLSMADDALRVLQEAIGFYPDYGDLWFLWGLLLRELGKKTDALDAFAKAMQLSIPDARYESNVTVCSEKACLNRAEILFELGEAEKALEEAMRCIEMNVRIVGAYLVAAKSFALIGEFGSAAEVLELAVQAGVDEEGIRELAARFRILAGVSY